MNSAPLVPMADRPAYRPVDLVETSEDTIWYNPLDYDVAVQVHVGAEGKRADTPDERARWVKMTPAERREKQTGIRTYVIPSKHERVIPNDFDMAIQHTQCAHPECLGSRGLYCKNAEHAQYKQIVGGLARVVDEELQRCGRCHMLRLHSVLTVVVLYE